MKKLISKTGLFSILFLLLFFSFSSVLAQNRSNSPQNKDLKDKKNESPQKGLDRICEKIDDTYAKLIERSEKLEGKINSSREQKRNTYENRLEERKQNTIENRGKVDDNFEKNISQMFSNAQSQEEKDAVETFRNTIESAREKRRKAVDEARKQFQETIRNQVQNREQSLGSSIEDFKSSIESAYKEAKAACENGEDIKSVRDSFRKNLKNNRLQFQNQKQNREKTGEIVSQAAKLKNDSVQKANQEFKETLEKAITTLKKDYTV